MRLSSTSVDQASINARLAVPFRFAAITLLQRFD